jgi:hypothetical protein
MNERRLRRFFRIYSRTRLAGRRNWSQRHLESASANQLASRTISASELPKALALARRVK